MLAQLAGRLEKGVADRGQLAGAGGRPERACAKRQVEGGADRGVHRTGACRLEQLAHEDSPSGVAISRNLAAMAGQAGRTRKALLA